MKAILDCDGGVDDLIAVLLALGHVQAGDLELLMVSTTFGNATCAAATRNMRCIIDAVNDHMTDNSKEGTELEVSVYHGADGPIVRPSPASTETWRARGWPGHGKDGLGNALDELVEEFDFGYTVEDLREQRAAREKAVVEASTSAALTSGTTVATSESDDNSNQEPLQAPRIPYTERAPLRMVEALERAGDEPVTVVCIGPLTNLAIALALDPSAVNRIGRLVVMGGSETGKGNCSLTAEFNFHADPEAARAVFEAFEAPNRHNTRIELVTWDLSVDIGVSWAYMDALVNGELSRHADRLRRARDNSGHLEKVARGEGSSACQRILGMTLAQFCSMCDDEALAAEEAGKPDQSCVLCDVLALLIAINPSVVEDSTDMYAMVEIGDGLCGGQVIFDWYNAKKQRPNVTLVKKVQKGALKGAFEAVVNAFRG